MIRKRCVIKEPVIPAPCPDDLLHFTLIGVCRDGSLYFGPGTTDPAAWSLELRRIVATLLESPPLLRAAAGDAEATARIPEHPEPMH